MPEGKNKPWWKKSQHPSTQILSSRTSGAGSPGGASSSILEDMAKVVADGRSFRR